MLALMYLAGRADLVAELIDGFEAGRHPTAVLKQADVSDAELASRFGLDPVWTTGLRAGENVTVPPPPTLEELVELQKRMAAAAESDQRA